MANVQYIYDGNDEMTEVVAMRREANLRILS